MGGMILKLQGWNNFTDYVLDEALSGEAMKLFVIDKIKKKLIFFHKNKKDIWFQNLDSCFAKHQFNLYLTVIDLLGIPPLAKN